MIRSLKDRCWNFLQDANRVDVGTNLYNLHADTFPLRMSVYNFQPVNSKKRHALNPSYVFTLKQQLNIIFTFIVEWSVN